MLITKEQFHKNIIAKYRNDKNLGAGGRAMLETAKRELSFSGQLNESSQKVEVVNNVGDIKPRL